tara:strand:+ start:1208 stop:3754 length:2547 start_codon:yes stop_codon:yes gene_type:complete
MADFKDVVLRLQENKNDNRQAFVEQTQELSKVFAESIKSQNRSFGQSLSLQTNKTNQTLTNIASTLQGLQSVFTADMKADKDFIGPLPEGQEQNINSLTGIYDVLVSIDTNLKEQFNYDKRADNEAERKALNQPGGLGSGAFPIPLPVTMEKGSKGGIAKMFGAAGALAAGALASAKGIATMGLAISAFFGGLVLGNEALGMAKESGFDFNMTATKDAAKGFSGIVQELSPEAMIALGGIIAAGAVATKGGGSATKMALGVGLMGAAITAFFGGLLLGNTVLEGVGSVVGTDFSGFKKVVAGFDSVISEMSDSTMLVIGTLIAAATVASFKTSLKGQAMGLAVASMGLAITGFFAGLVAGDALLEGISVIGGNLNLSNLKSVVIGFNDVIGALTTESLTALGVIFGLSFLTSYGTASKALKVGYGMTAIGAGISGFFVGLAAGDAALSFLGTDFTALPTLIQNFGDAIGNLSDRALVVLGSLLGAGGLIGKLGGAGSVAIGMGAIGAGIAAFFAAFGVADFVAANVGDGSSFVNLVKNFGEAIGSLDTTALIALGGLLGAGAIFGMVPGAAGAAAIGMTMIGAGIAGFFLAFDGLAKLGSVIGVDGSSTKKLIENMVSGVAKLNEIDGDNLQKVVGPLALVGPAILAFMGSDGIAGAAAAITDKVKGFFNFIFGKDEEEGPQRTIIDEMVDLLKPVDQLNNVNLDGFIEATNALSEFVNTDYRGSADDFEYFVNKLYTTMPKLEGAVFGDEDIMGLAYNTGGYVQASKNINMLKNALAGNLAESTDINNAATGTGATANLVNSNTSSYQTNNNSTYSVASSSVNKDRTVVATNNVNGSFYDVSFSEDF